MSMAQELVTDATQDQFSQCAARMMPNDDEVGLEVLSGLKQDVGGSAVGHQSLVMAT